MLKAGVNVLAEPSGMLLHGGTVQKVGFDPAWSYTIDMAMWLQMLEAGALIATKDVTASFRVSLSPRSADLTKTQTAEVTRFAEQVLAPAVGRELRRGGSAGPACSDGDLAVVTEHQSGRRWLAGGLLDDDVATEQRALDSAGVRHMAAFEEHRVLDLGVADMTVVGD
jgi:hypothetical protein